jgi:hypothetical protein
MPIRKENRGRYPADWKSISARIRYDRAGGRCECAGQCGRGHPGRCEAVDRRPHPQTGSLVVLTVAHLDHVPEHSDDSNLAAMCQACHLSYDAALHVANARRTRQTRGMSTLW